MTDDWWSGLRFKQNLQLQNQAFSYNDMTRLDHWPLGYNVSDLPRFLVQQENLIDQLSPRTTKRNFFQALIFFSYRTFKHLKVLFLWQTGHAPYTELPFL